ncbi:hypothetical protein [Nocardia brasiliensis]|uniref:hypothetical protein n=1 Tax=Nocardia brasiliensis TaxID=37326 RepID=UPI002456FA45|nr:hypothetical protein [Nocardia brasiliensis]
MLPTFTAGEFIKAASSSPNQNCVRINRKDGWTAVWDDKLADTATAAETPVPFEQLLILTDEQFDDFQSRLRAGDIDGACIEISRRHDGTYAFCATAAALQPVSGVELNFDHSEVEAFESGVQHREFELSRFTAA